MVEAVNSAQILMPTDRCTIVVHDNVIRMRRNKNLITRINHLKDYISEYKSSSTAFDIELLKARLRTDTTTIKHPVVHTAEEQQRHNVPEILTIQHDNLPKPNIEASNTRGGLFPLDDDDDEPSLMSSPSPSQPQRASVHEPIRIAQEYDIDLDDVAPVPLTSARVTTTATDDWDDDPYHF